MLLATLSASLLRNKFVGKEVTQAAYETKAGQFLMPSNPFPNFHWVKSVHIRSYSGPHFLAFGLNTERYSVSLCIQSKCEKVQTRITPNTDTFHAVFEIQRYYQNELIREIIYIILSKMGRMYWTLMTINQKKLIR